MKRWLLLTLLLTCEPLFAEDRMEFDTPPESVLKAIQTVIEEQLYEPEIEDYLSDELAQQVAATRVQLEPLLNDNPEWVGWLANAEFEGAYDYTSKLSELRTSLVNYLGEMPDGAQYLYQLATESWSSEYREYDSTVLQSDAIRTLGEIKAITQLEQLMIPLMTAVSYQPEILANEFELYLKQLANNQIHSTLPQLQRVQANLERFVEQGSDAALDYRYSIAIALDHLTITRAALADSEVLLATIQLSFDKRESTRESAKTALQLLIQQLGDDNILQYLPVSGQQPTNPQSHYRILSKQHEDELVRSWALQRFIAVAIDNDKEAELIAHLLSCLNDESWRFQMTAAQQLIKMGQAISHELYKSLAATETPLNAKYVLLYVLASLDEDVKPIMAAVKDAYVPLPEFITPLMRRAIISQWGDRTEVGTDFRWLTEYLLITTTEVKQAEKAYPVEQRIESLVAAFKHKDIEVDSVLNYGFIMSQGLATFTVVKMEDDETDIEIVASEDRVDHPMKMVGTGAEATFVAVKSGKAGQLISAHSDWINISELGPFAFYERASSTKYADADASSSDIEETTMSSSSHGMRPSEMYRADKYREIVAKQGFIWLSKQQLEFTIPGLNIYYFGDRGPLSVKDLLFYWQD